MTLHGKIAIWLVVFGTLCVVLFGVGDYIQSRQALRVALEMRAQNEAVQLAEDVEQRHERLAADLAALAAAGGRAATSAEGQAATEDADSVAGCSYGNVAVPLPGLDGAGRRRARDMPVAEFFAPMSAVVDPLGTRGYMVVLEQGSAAVVMDGTCALNRSAEKAALLQLIASSERVDGRRARVLRNGGGDRIVASADIEGIPWMALAVMSFDEYAAPFIRLRRQYILLVSLVLLVFLSVLMVALKRQMSRLSTIARAADEIGMGRFDVWLPPPTADEIGRVALALGRMVNRLSVTLRRVEVRRSMAAVGEMATYLSHEIRNPLSAIRLNLQMLQRDLARGTVPEDGEEVVGHCLSELQRLDNVVKTVLEVGRTGRDARGSCDAHAVITETLQVMQGKLRDRGVEVERDLRAPEHTVAIAPAALRSIMVNLLLNAMDALAETDGPRISIRTGVVREDAEDGRFELSVSDNGPGVPSHIGDRIFDPFFTTKPTGHGIGLSTAIQVAQECGGFLRHEAAAGGGAMFTLELPIVIADPDAVAAGALETTDEV